jgi:hypothetical protein
LKGRVRLHAAFRISAQASGFRNPARAFYPLSRALKATCFSLVVSAQVVVAFATFARILLRDD